MIEALCLLLEPESTFLSQVDERTNDRFSHYQKKKLTTSSPVLVGAGTAAPSSLLSLSSLLHGWSLRGPSVSGLGAGKEL